MTPEERLRELGIELPPAPKPVGSYVTAVRSGNLLFLSGMLPLRDGGIRLTGKVGDGEGDIGVAAAALEARQAALNGLSVLKHAAGGLGNVARCVKITGYVASARGFTGQPAVLNGASELMQDVFGERGLHARAAVGVHELPLGSPVEIEFIFELNV